MKKLCISVLVLFGIGSYFCSVKQDVNTLSREESVNIVGGACDGCFADWYSTTDFSGGYAECDHGPEHDNSSACVAALASGTVVCKEVDPVQGNCDCFKCGTFSTLACEGEVLRYRALCGLDPTPECKTDDEMCETYTTGEMGIVRKEYNSSIQGGPLCGDGTGGHETTVNCGEDDSDPQFPPTNHMGCFTGSGNCVTVGGVVIQYQGDIEDCQAT